MTTENRVRATRIKESGKRKGLSIFSSHDDRKNKFRLFLWPEVAYFQCNRTWGRISADRSQKEFGFIIVDLTKTDDKRDSDRFKRRSEAPVLKSI